MSDTRLPATAQSGGGITEQTGARGARLDPLGGLEDRRELAVPVGDRAGGHVLESLGPDLLHRAHEGPALGLR